MTQKIKGAAAESTLMIANDAGMFNLHDLGYVKLYRPTHAQGAEVIAVGLYSRKGVTLQKRKFADLESQKRWLGELRDQIEKHPHDDLEFLPDGSAIRFSPTTIRHAGFKPVEHGVLICIYSTMPHPVGSKQQLDETDPLIRALVDSRDDAQAYLDQLAARLNAQA